MDITEQLTHESRIALAAAAEITRLRAALEDLTADRDSWIEQDSARTADAVQYLQERDAARAEAEALRADAAKLRTLLAVVPLPPETISLDFGWAILNVLQAAAIERAAQGGEHG